MQESNCRFIRSSQQLEERIGGISILILRFRRKVYFQFLLLKVSASIPLAFQGYESRSCL